MPGCAAIGCNNRSEKGYTMKCFPRNPKLRKIWTEGVARADWSPSNNSFLCHVHFETDQWTITQSGRIKLKKNAIPSIFTVTSTRKSPKKRSKLANGEDEDLYIIEYLDDSGNQKLTSSVKNTTYNRYTTSNVTTIIDRPTHDPRSSCRTATKNRQECDEIVVSDVKSETSVKDTKRTNGIVDEKINRSDIKIKSEMKSQNDSNCELDDIEEKLRSICDGETQIDDKAMAKRDDDYDKKNEKINGKNGSQKCSYEEKYTAKCSSTRKNGNSIMEKKDISDIGNATKRKRRSRYEIMKDVKNTAINENNTINGITSPMKNSEKSRTETSDIMRRSTFTIKLTGTEEDVTEIVEGLGTEPILKYKSSNELSNGNKSFVTSVISVTDGFSMIKSENNDNEAKPKLEIQDSSSNDINNDTLPRINGNERDNDNTTKLSVESPNDDENFMDLQRLRKKVKFQEDVIRKLTSQLRARKDLEITTNHINTRSQSKRQKITQISCNGDCQCESKYTLINELKSKLKNTEETIKRLNNSLNEEKQNAKTFKLQIRQRNKRIKEMNWKWNKASKYLERAERNTNNYRNRMITMRKALIKKNADVKIQDTLINAKNMEKSIVPSIETTKNSFDECQMEICENKDVVAPNESIVYRTVQDIFDESNHCDDDDPIIIDNPEDFMRQFAGSL